MSAKLTISGEKALYGKLSPSMIPARSGYAGPSNHVPEMPDFESLYATPEAQKRQDKEAEQSVDRRRASWRDFNFDGFHGSTAPDEPLLRYIEGETSTADAAIKQPRHFLTPQELKERQQRIERGLDYEHVQGKTRKKKKGKV